MNAFERAARDRKVILLVEAIDAELGEHVTGAQARAIADQLGSWPREAWAQLAKKAGCKAPSETTVVEVMGVFRRRALPPAPLRKGA